MLEFLKDLESVKVSATNETLYKKECFKDAKSEKNVRKKIRSILKTFISISKVDEKVVKDFNIFYKNVYCLQDYSVKSLANKDTKDYSLEDIENFLTKVKKVKNYAEL
jgi:hypothetical protein